MNPQGQSPKPSSPAKPGKARGKQSRRNLVALGSAAVIVVYGAGYLRTATAAAQLAAAMPATTPATTPKDTLVRYKDGLYFGSGSCRHGTLEASVMIEKGRIVAAAISQCHTRYSKSVIAKLPGQAVERQSPYVDEVSGATESSDAFYNALREALKKAE